MPWETKEGADFLHLLKFAYGLALMAAVVAPTVQSLSLKKSPFLLLKLLSVNASRDMIRITCHTVPKTKAGAVAMRKNKSVIFEAKMNDLQLSHMPRG